MTRCKEISDYVNCRNLVETIQRERQSMEDPRPTDDVSGVADDIADDIPTSCVASSSHALGDVGSNSLVLESLPNEQEARKAVEPKAPESVSEATNSPDHQRPHSAASAMTVSCRFCRASICVCGLFSEYKGLLMMLPTVLSF